MELTTQHPNGTPTSAKERREYIVKSISIPRRDLTKLMKEAKRQRRSFSSYLVNCALTECQTRALNSE